MHKPVSVPYPAASVVLNRQCLLYSVSVLKKPCRFSTTILDQWQPHGKWQRDTAQHSWSTRLPSMRSSECINGCSIFHKQLNVVSDSFLISSSRPRLHSPPRRHSTPEQLHHSTETRHSSTLHSPHIHGSKSAHTPLWIVGKWSTRRNPCRHT